MTNSQFNNLTNTVSLAFAFCLFSVLSSSTLCTSTASAGTINIQLTGLGVLYDGDNDEIHDTKGAAGGTLDPGDADHLTSAVFRLDGAIKDVRTMGDSGGNLYGDLLIDNAGASIPQGALTTVGGGGAAFGFDLFTSPNNDVPLLRLNMDEVELLINSTTAFFFGDATVVSENLPAGLAFGAGKKVAFSYTAALPSVGAASPTTMFASNGTVNISGLMAIPEPTAIALLMIGLVPLSLLASRRVA